ncbi:MAG TPA: ABC transporter permease [Terriglobia bacterium]|nr:ABC transporter permease [Terriglobia bacterium]
MSLLRNLVGGLRALFGRKRAERDMNDELRGYLVDSVKAKMRAGLSREDALRAARMEMGSIEAVKEEVRSAGWESHLESLWQDMRYGARMLRKNPGFTLVAVLTLALGIGANTAIFQLLDGVRLRTLPVSNPQELAELRLADRTGLRGSEQSGYPVLTNSIWERVRDHPPEAFSGLFAWAEDDFNVAPMGEVRHAQGLWVSGGFFRVLRVHPILGRVFTAADDRRDCGLPGAVVSYAFWRRQLGGAAGVIGSKMTLDYAPVEIIGVTPATFTGLDVGQSFDVALPICSQPTLVGGQYSVLDDGTIWWLSVMGRLKSGSTFERATAQLSASSPGLFEATLPRNYPRENIKDYLRFRLGAYPAGTGLSWLRQQYEDPLWLLLATAALVLLIACANLANLMLARASIRARETAVRLALGASRGRLIRQLMAESLLLAAMGASLGLLLAGALSRFMVAFLSTDGNSVFLDLQPDWRVLSFTTGVAVLTCLLFGLVPAWRATRVAPGAAMKAGGRGLTATRERFGLRRVLVAAQVALSMTLLVGALLFSRSLHNLMTVNTGFKQDGVLIAWLDLSNRLNLPFERRVSFKQELLDRIRSIPGVNAASDVRFLPLGGGATDNLVWKNGSDPRGQRDVYFNWVSRDYFKTLQTPLLAGRDFDTRDTPTSPPVAIVNQAFARDLGLGPNPVGQEFRRQATPSDPEMVFTIVGLVADTDYRDIHKGFVPIAFLATEQDTRFTNWSVQVLIRSNAPVADLTSRVRESVAKANPEITTEFQVFKTTIRDGLLRERLMATLSGFFGFLAALLASVGLYGVMSYVVVRRTNEIGIRMTLGADRREIVAMIVREAGTLLAAGLGVGVALALAGGRAASSLLFGLKPYDPVTLALAIALLAVVAAAASYLPARQATKVDPMVALRCE